MMRTRPVATGYLPVLVFCALVAANTVGALILMAACRVTAVGYLVAFTAGVASIEALLWANREADRELPR